MARKFSTLEEYAAEDQRLEQEADKRRFALMRHRWEAVNIGGHSNAAYARAIGRSKTTVRQYVVGWELACRESGDAPDRTRASFDFSQLADRYIELANAGAVKRDALEAVAELHGVSIGQARKDHGDEVRTAARHIKAGREVVTEQEAKAIADPSSRRPLSDAAAAYPGLDDPARAASLAAAQVEQERRERERREHVRNARQTSAHALVMATHRTIAKAMLGLEDAARLIRDADEDIVDGLDSEDIDGLHELVNRARAAADLVDHLLGVEPKGSHDWDAALARLTEEQ